MKNQLSKPARSSASPKTKKINRIFLCILAVLLAANLLLPNTGALVLLDEFCIVAILWTVITWCVIQAVGLRKHSAAKAAISKKDIILILVAIVIILSAVFMISRNIVLDLIHGEQTIVLSRCSVEKAGTSKGIISLDYYLLGYDESGETQRFAIAGEDYYALLDRYGEHPVGGWSSTVHGYLYTGRVVSIG